jgi:EmrB/QacA subfamily drug resistance transporter
MPFALGKHRNASPPFVLAIICVGIFVGALDQTVVYGALPDMMSDLHLSVLQLDRAAWIVIGYLIGYTIAMPLMGRVSDVHGHVRIYVLSISLFMVSSIFVALAPNLSWMIAARVFQALGAGAMVPIAMAIIADIFPNRSKIVPLGIIGAVVEGGGALGPFYGGALAYLLDWRWIFWINLPISLIVIVLIFLFLKPSPRVPAKIDYIGGVLLAAALAVLSLALWQGSLAETVSLLAAAMFLFALFVFRESRVSEPLIDLRMFRNVTFSSASITNLFVGGALIIALVNVPLMSDTILGTTALEGGLRLLRLTAMISIGAVIGGFLCRRFGYRLPTMFGLILSAIGLFFMSGWALDISDPEMTFHLATSGFGFGLVIAPLATAVIDSVGEERTGIGSSLAVMMRMVGMIIGLSALASWGMGQFHEMTAGMTLAEILALPEELIGSILAIFHDFFLASAGICLAAILAASWLRRRGGSKLTGHSDSANIEVSSTPKSRPIRRS